VVANIGHPLVSGPVPLNDLADSTWIVYAANMPMRRYLEQEFQNQDPRFPGSLIETTSCSAGRGPRPCCRSACRPAGPQGILL
jgi:DNA-binding transcriptional LysR family regulator